MFCYLEKIELKIDYCPAESCIYKTKESKCKYKELSPDYDEAGKEIPVTVQQVHEVKGVKIFIAKTEAARARFRLRVGIAMLAYSDYVKSRTSTLAQASASNEKMDLPSKQDDKELDDTQVIERFLLSTFGLSIVEHQPVFFDKAVFKSWLKTLPAESFVKEHQLDLSVFLSTILEVEKLHSSKAKLNSATANNQTKGQS